MVANKENIRDCDHIFKDSEIIFVDLGLQLKEATQTRDEKWLPLWKMLFFYKLRTPEKWPRSNLIYSIQRSRFKWENKTREFILPVLSFNTMLQKILFFYDLGVWYFEVTRHETYSGWLQQYFLQSRWWDLKLNI